MLTVIDYGLGNLRSVTAKFERLRLPYAIAHNEKEILKASKLILPGVGHFDEGMKNLKSKGLIEAIKEKVLKEKTPILGICLGMQLLVDSSEEGDEEGLSLLPLTCKRFYFNGSGPNLRVPHMGWNNLRNSKNHQLLSNLSEERRFYFAHSFFVEDSAQDFTLASCDYGKNFCAVIAKENIAGVQFHPEKSHRDGLKLLENFAKWTQYSVIN